MSAAIVPHRLATRTLRTLSPVLCAVGVGLGAYASHAGEGADRARLGLAALFAFGHGLALIALETGARPSRMGAVARASLLAGVLLFSGSLAIAALAGWQPQLAPAGGSLLILGWLLVAADRLRGQGH